LKSARAIIDLLQQEPSLSITSNLNHTNKNETTYGATNQVSKNEWVTKVTNKKGSIRDNVQITSNPYSILELDKTMRIM
jgi:hypothetical protein